MPLTGERKREYMRHRHVANRERLNKKSADYYATHRGQALAVNKAYAKAHPEVNKAARDKYRAKKRQDPAWNVAQAARMQEWRKDNHEAYLSRLRKWRKNRLATNPNYKITCRLRARLQKKLMNRGIRKVATTHALTGCTTEFLRGYLEARFKPGMTWNNIHIDHVLPLAKFDLTNEEDQRKAFHYTNLQPLFGVDNLRKGTKTTELCH